MSSFSRVNPAPPGAGAAASPAARPGSGSAAAARPRVVLLAAVARDRTIGRDGGMPWHFPEDLRAFKANTMGTALVMGRRTFESIGRPLPERDNIVLTSAAPATFAAAHPGVFTAPSLAAGIDLAASRGAATVSVIGGGQVYEAALPLADEMILTSVPHDGGGDTFFPVWHEVEWTETRRRVVGRCVTVWYSRNRPRGAARPAGVPKPAGASRA